MFLGGHGVPLFRLLTALAFGACTADDAYQDAYHDAYVVETESQPNGPRGIRFLDSLSALLAPTSSHAWLTRYGSSAILVTDMPTAGLTLLPGGLDPFTTVHAHVDVPYVEHVSAGTAARLLSVDRFGRRLFFDSIAHTAWIDSAGWTSTPRALPSGTVTDGRLQSSGALVQLVSDSVNLVSIGSAFGGLPSRAAHRHAQAESAKPDPLPFAAFATSSTAVVQVAGGRPRLYFMERWSAGIDSVYIPSIRRWSMNHAVGRIDTFPSRPAFLATLNDSVAVVVYQSVRRSSRRISYSYFVSLVDFRGYRVCLDLPLPQVRQVFARFGIVGDTLFALVAPPDAMRSRTPSVSRVWRWELREADCPWGFVQKNM